MRSRPRTPPRANATETCCRPMLLSCRVRYHIERRIGAGGMAEVYEATLAGEAGFQRKVAIKRLALGLVDDPGARQSFLDGARIAGSLNHAGIVAVVDYGIVDGCPVQVLEWIDGID